MKSKEPSGRPGLLYSLTPQQQRDTSQIRCHSLSPTATLHLSTPPATLSPLRLPLSLSFSLSLSLSPSLSPSLSLSWSLTVPLCVNLCVSGCLRVNVCEFARPKMSVCVCYLEPVVRALGDLVGCISLQS